MKEVDMLNYVKLDVLGLDCVGLINQTCEFAGIERLTPDNMKFDDMEVWGDIAEDCTMIFQFESEFAGSYLQDILKEETIERIKKVNPNFSYIDLMSMANGAIRPAGASYRTELSQGIYRDNGHPELNKFLAPTLGYLVYQEQIIEFLHKFCGFTMGEADVVRRGFAKKSGTDVYIPIIKNGGYLTDDKKHYIKGFIQTMKDDHNVETEEAENLIVNFLQVMKRIGSCMNYW
jgi:DNA polymerase-3 subunit alpha